ncbi:MAG: hypothetical protein KY454_07365 [Actinobacteria bacterium]|nr:hypothetical protein [Actinomycetota bacterium]
MERKPGPEERMSATPLYALGRLHRAIETATTHHDPEIRRRAEQKALAWEAVLSGMAMGMLDVGSRTPVANTPAWVTLEVAHGGFATGRYMAEGPIADDERAWLARVPSAVDAADRMRLNTWFLSDEGLQHLGDLLRSGHYSIDVPEHGALLVVAWLVENGQDALALDLVSELYPLLDRLRFYPVETERAPTSGAVVHLRTAGDVADQLRRIEVPEQVAAMNEALLTWLPLYDRLVALWLETVEDDWPCRRWPADWTEGRANWLRDYDMALASARLSNGYQKPRSTFAILRDALERCVVDSSALSGRDVGRVRMALRRSVERWGEPGSHERESLRTKQREWASRPTHKQVAQVVVDRVAQVPADAGIGDLTPILEPVHLGTNATAEVPSNVARKIERALEAPIEELIERRVVPSSEVLAQVLPQITSHVAAGAFDDSILRDLYARIYAAFRRRRSLLLLNLEHQVQIDELPWIGAVEPFRKSTADSQVKAVDTLRHASLLAFTSFPQTILPNPLVRELDALAKEARLDLPFVEEVAADIFMGTFTLKWREAAAVAAEAMEDTLYARYFDLPPAETWGPIDEASGGLIGRVRERWGKRTAEDFTRVCNERAREAAFGDGSFVARNGTVIEQSQILTTHNLAQLTARLGLEDRVRVQAAEFSHQAFVWIVKEQNTKYSSWRSKLQMLKNAAYAWRQALFFLSFAEAGEQRRTVDELKTMASDQPQDWQQRFAPVIAGLDEVLGGSRFDGQGRAGSGRRYLGWSVGRHWLLPADARTEQRPT